MKANLPSLLYWNTGKGMHFQGGNTLVLNPFQPSDCIEIVANLGTPVVFNHELYTLITGSHCFTQPANRETCVSCPILSAVSMSGDNKNWRRTVPSKTSQCHTPTTNVVACRSMHVIIEKFDPAAYHQPDMHGFLLKRNTCVGHPHVYTEQKRKMFARKGKQEAFTLWSG